MNWTTFSIVLRESLEALLIIGILTSVLKKDEATTKKHWMFLIFGVLAGIFVSIALGTSIMFIPDAVSESTMNYIDVGFPLVAGLMIIHVMWWMHKNAKNLKSDLTEKVENALNKQSLISLSLIAFLAVAREGLETVLFLSGELIEATANKLVNLSLQIALAVVVSYVIYVLLQKTLGKLHYKWFFRVTNVLLFAAAVQLIYTAYSKYQALA
ncbi:FTR1 family protein [Pseudobdellovibrio sp. HCB154]|uniref:FTR1 family iron permease n=1 Tax=Pseudobdellovibrio sp. HCB154 TaxID=3386277 RepID=UPI00391748BD